MKLLANENLPLSSVKYLEKEAHNVLYIGRDYMGISDREVMNLSIKENRTILTFDKDYGNLIFKHNYRPTEGVLYLRLNNYKPKEPGKIVAKLLKSIGFNPKKQHNSSNRISYTPKKVLNKTHNY